MTKEIFKILNRWTDAVIFSAEIEVTPDMSVRFKLGLAVKSAYKVGADLTDADLSGADLSGADLTDADLSGADLTDADLSGADLSGANLTRANLTRANLTRANLTRANLTDETLRPFKADLFLTLSELRASAQEAQHLIQKLRAGQVDGHSYGHGNVTECACLVGTIAQPRELRGDALNHDSGRPAERWFMMINSGDKPTDETGGGYASKKALEWAIDWCDAHGFELPTEAVEVPA